jgi:predicted DNA repair protein MutK
MAGTTLLALLDDIATILDDVATMTKVAAKKTAGVLGDDLALNAQQVTGVQADRELPVVWAVAKGSLVNKAILVPAALLISWLLPWLITPLLMVGGAFLCFEGCEKLAHKWLHSPEEGEAEHQKTLQALADPAVDLVAFERDKIKGAVRTDFILSAEIVVITLGAVAGASLALRVGVLVGISLLMTVGVYGLVAGIVKLDDLGLRLQRSASGLARALGAGLLRAAPWLMKTLSVVGTAAMFMVGGGILLHGWPALAHAVEAWAAGWGSLLAAVINTVAGAAVGLVAGALVLAVVMGVQRLRSPQTAA